MQGQEPNSLRTNCRSRVWLNKKSNSSWIFKSVSLPTLVQSDDCHGINNALARNSCGALPSLPPARLLATPIAHGRGAPSIAAHWRRTTHTRPGRFPEEGVSAGKAHGALVVVALSAPKHVAPGGNDDLAHIASPAGSLGFEAHKSACVPPPLSRTLRRACTRLLISDWLPPWFTAGGAGLVDVELVDHLRLLLLHGSGRRARTGRDTPGLMRLLPHFVEIDWRLSIALPDEVVVSHCPVSNVRADVVQALLCHGSLSRSAVSKRQEFVCELAEVDSQRVVGAAVRENRLFEVLHRVEHVV